MSNASTLTVTDYFQDEVSHTFSADAAGYESAFRTFADQEDMVELGYKLISGVVADDASDNGVRMIERAKEPLAYWQRMCALIATETQRWTVG